MRVLLVSTYDLGRQPFGLASPAAWLRRAGADVDCVDASREPLSDEVIQRADLVAVYLPMHTATRLAEGVIERSRRLNPRATLAAYGLYAPLNAGWLRGRGVAHVLGPEAEGELVDLVNGQLPTANAQLPTPNAQLPTSELPRSPGIPKLRFIQPDRSTLPPPSRYAALQMPDGSRRVVASTDASRGCKHLCRHCPIVPVYRGAFRAVAADVVLADIRAQVDAGAGHVSFGDPDFFNGPAHARRIVERLARECPGVSYDVTIKIEHLLAHAAMLPLLRDTGCLFVTSAVESLDDAVLARLRKGHTRADFVRAVDLCRRAGLRLSPTFIPFTPWTTPAGYAELLDALCALDLQDDVAPVQLGIRLLVTAQSALLELDDVRRAIAPFDPASLTYPWTHSDADMDRLQEEVMAVVASMRSSPRRDVFDAIDALARGRTGAATRSTRRCESIPPPHLTEAWYCCAEPAHDIDRYL